MVEPTLPISNHVLLSMCPTEHAVLSWLLGSRESLRAETVFQPDLPSSRKSTLLRIAPLAYTPTRYSKLAPPDTRSMTLL